MLQEFKKFAVKGNAIDMAVGIMIGGAFGTIVKSLVEDVLMPPIGLLMGEVDFGDFFFVLKSGAVIPEAGYASIAAAKEAGAVTLNYGLFLNAVVSFLILAWVVFLLVRSLNKLKTKEEAAPVPGPTKDQELLTDIRDLLKSKTGGT